MSSCTFISSDRPPAYECTYILILVDNSVDKGSVRWCVNKFYGYNCAIDFVEINEILSESTDVEFPEIVINFLTSCNYDYIYITTQDRKKRKQIRQLLLNRYGIKAHIQTYAKLVNSVNRMMMFK